MYILLKKKLVVLLFIIFTTSIAHSSVGYITYFEPNKGAQFGFTDQINFPGYSWPRTLVECFVDFQKVELQEDELVLIDQNTGKAVQFQLCEKKMVGTYLHSAQVVFFSDLPSGEKREYILQRKSKDFIEAIFTTPKILVNKNDKNFDISTGVFSVGIISDTQNRTNSQGPIAYIKRNGRSIGSSIIDFPTNSLQVTSRTVIQEELGPLVAKYVIRYEFSNGGIYSARIKIIAGYQYFEFEENINKDLGQQKVSLEFIWNKFNPSYRWAPGLFQKGCKIDRPLITAWTHEDPHWTPGWREDPAKEMVMRLLPYQGNAVRESAPCVSFWEDENKADNFELSLFVLDHEKWQDKQYQVWQPSTKLQVTFRYVDNKLIWRFPLNEGSRSTAIALLDPVYEQNVVHELYDEYEHAGLKTEKWPTIRGVQLMQQIYGPLNLNKVIHWQLNYPNDLSQKKTIFPTGKFKSADQYEKWLFTTAFVRYPLGINVSPGVVSIAHRFVYDQAIVDYNRLYPTFTPEQKSRIDALLLLAGYVTYGEEMHPLRNALAGCPNITADGWCVPAQISFVFPQHPMAQEWFDYYQRSWQINHMKYTRPDVTTYNSKGGRWTESIATYNWAHLRPTGYSQFAGLLTDGKNRWPSYEAALRGRWLIDMVTAPIFNPSPYWRQNYRKGKPTPPSTLDTKWKPGDEFDLSKGFTRQYPAHGAHGSGTTMEIPKIVELYGHFMQNYDPLLAENMLWVAWKGDASKHQLEVRADDPWFEVISKRYPINHGTNPHLKSEKYTGHGIVLRSGVDTPQELSIHLDQIDRGPNYRWGVDGENASGVLYYYANGRCYTGHERESTGDHSTNDNDGITTFGVMKDYAYRSIGMNVLTEPLYDLGVAQFSEIKSREGKGGYSSPEYKSRSIMLIGTDYWVLCDEIRSDWRFRARFSWFVAKDMTFPKLFFLAPESIRQDHWSEGTSAMSKGFYRDFGVEHDFLHTVLVTHHDDIEMPDMQRRKLNFLTNEGIYDYRKDPNTDTPDGVWKVNTAKSNDLIFRSLGDLNYENGDILFTGKAGVIRKMKDGQIKMSMFHSQRIGVASLSLQVDDSNIGISCCLKDNLIEGEFFSPRGGILSLKGDATNSKKFYIDGIAINSTQKSDVLSVNLPRGKHEWQLVSNANDVRPQRPEVLYVRQMKGYMQLEYTKTPAAQKYLIQISEDDGITWKQVLESTETKCILTGLANGKSHVRVIAVNDEITSKPSNEWPVYVNEKTPHYPEGLSLKIYNNNVKLNWGRVLGITEYRLYRRQSGSKDFELIYSGDSRGYTDKNLNALVAPYELPGIENNFLKPTPVVYEYAVSAVNGYGEGEQSYTISTDPKSWLNWSPVGRLKFNRRTAYWSTPFVQEDQQPPVEYPE